MNMDAVYRTICKPVTKLNLLFGRNITKQYFYYFVSKNVNVIQITFRPVLRVTRMPFFSITPRPKPLKLHKSTMLCSITMVLFIFTAIMHFNLKKQSATVLRT